MNTLFRALAALPLPVLHGMGAALGWIVFWASPTLRRRSRENAAQAGYGAAELHAAVAHAGKLVAETPRLWFGAPVRVGWDGEDLIVDAQRRGRGLLFLTPHLGCFEVTAQ